MKNLPFTHIAPNLWNTKGDLYWCFPYIESEWRQMLASSKTDKKVL